MTSKNEGDALRERNCIFLFPLYNAQGLALGACGDGCNLAEKVAQCSSYLVRCGHIVHYMSIPI